ncbi:CBS domain-containing protein [Tindallia californiensis]|uniref:CBS domain-containing protein n=1 Tax=Tindallia californiensis TaxID=159292 RepID=A0A1H3LB41_9FIRM|nr:CBS domain-containing protein [Tindallia californiensis]SDY61389.1 CBS domain-containing protein [Tindallia californiensis]
MQVHQRMKSNVISVKPIDPLSKVLDIMEQQNINGTPVIDDANHLIGMIVKADIYRFLMDPGHYKSCPVEWVMSSNVVYGETHEDLVTIAKRLREHDIVALPILEKDIIVGIVSIEDILDHFIETHP